MPTSNDDRSMLYVCLAGISIFLQHGEGKNNTNSPSKLFSSHHVEGTQGNEWRTRQERKKDRLRRQRTGRRERSARAFAARREVSHQRNSNGDKEILSGAKSPEFGKIAAGDGSFAPIHSQLGSKISP